MKKSAILGLLLLSQSSFAETLSAKVFSLESVGKKTLIKFDNGRVAWTTDTLALVPGERVTAEIDSVNTLVSLSPTSGLVGEETTPKFLDAERPAFAPSILTNYGAAAAMFDRLNPKFERVSECSDRAHVWAYDEFKNKGIRTEKIFIFFTKTYIDKNNFKWWFHVAPLVSVSEGEGIQRRVLDYRYTDGPKLIKEWSDLLVFSKRDCKMTTKFSEYDVNPQTEDCYMMIDSMYYRLPGDLSLQETAGSYRSQFNEAEVSGARARAFRRGDL
jgi:Glutaminase